jgi:hypothetical protein
MDAIEKTIAALRTIESLRFDHRRTLQIEATDGWLATSELTAIDREQLVAILAVYDRTITMARALTTAPATLFKGGLDAFAECAIEWYDVLDQNGTAQFQLWLYYGDGGLLFSAGTTSPVAQINNSSFYGDERGLDDEASERLEALLRAAKKRAMKMYPETELATVDF